MFIQTIVTCDIAQWSRIVIVLTQEPGIVICVCRIATNTQESNISLVLFMTIQN